VAGVCITKLGIELPALIDEADNRAERAKKLNSGPNMTRRLTRLDLCEKARGT
jgi:hypothetical protein